MLFGVNYCRRGTKKRRATGGRNTWRLCACIFCLLAITGLLFLAPQWLLVVLIMLLTIAVVALITYAC